jgi:hypothetical protein
MTEQLQASESSDFTISQSSLIDPGTYAVLQTGNRAWGDPYVERTRTGQYFRRASCAAEDDKRVLDQDTATLECVSALTSIMLLMDSNDGTCFS